MTLIVFVTPDCKPVIFKSTVCSLSTNFETKVADLPVIVTGEPFGFPNAGGFVGLTLGIIGILLLTTPGIFLAFLFAFCFLIATFVGAAGAYLEIAGPDP